MDTTEFEELGPSKQSIVRIFLEAHRAHKLAKAERSVQKAALYTEANVDGDVRRARDEKREAKAKVKQAREALETAELDENFARLRYYDAAHEKVGERLDAVESEYAKKWEKYSDARDRLFRAEKLSA